MAVSHAGRNASNSQRHFIIFILKELKEPSQLFLVDCMVPSTLPSGLFHSLAFFTISITPSQCPTLFPVTASLEQPSSTFRFTLAIFR